MSVAVDVTRVKGRGHELDALELKAVLLHETHGLLVLVGHIVALIVIGICVLHIPIVVVLRFSGIIWWGTWGNDSGVMPLFMGRGGSRVRVSWQIGIELEGSGGVI